MKTIEHCEIADQSFKILVVDDEPEIVSMVRRLLRDPSREITGVSTAAAARRFMAESSLDLMILDLRLPDADGMTLLEEIRKQVPALPVVVLTGYGTITHAIQATRLGAVDMIEKTHVTEHLRRRVDHLQQMNRLEQDRNAALNDYGDETWTEAIVGSSIPMMTLKRTIRRVAAAGTTVLVTGETGTGKELVSRALHAHSSRRSGPFVTVDCAAINETTSESELFGHVRGAFTGAFAANPGLLRTAHGGTLFFDEIGELPVHIQAKLLRTIQELEVRPVGSPSVVPVDIRVIAATNRNLRMEMERGTFRQDLFYRLNAITIEIPPLRDRDEDVVSLFHYFLTRLTGFENTPFIDPEVISIIQHYQWPGNVREMQNVVRHAAAFADSEQILPVHLPDYLRSGETGATPLDLSLREREIQAIRDALKSTGGNRRATASVLGVGIATLYRKLKQYDLG